MRRKMASAVDGCSYNRRNTVPGSCSRYSNERSDETDMLNEAPGGDNAADWYHGAMILRGVGLYVTGGADAPNHHRHTKPY